jgi:hypothetical protein
MTDLSSTSSHEKSTIHLRLAFKTPLIFGQKQNQILFKETSFFRDNPILSRSQPS